MQTARQIAYRYGPRTIYRLGRYAYRKLRSYRKKSAKKRQVKLFYEAQNITANINFNYGFNLQWANTGSDPGTVTNAFQMLGAYDIANSLVLSEAHRAYARLYDQYKIASVALFYMPYSLVDSNNAYKNHEILQGNVFGVIDNTFKDGGVNDMQWSFLQVLQNPKTKYVLWSTGGGLQYPLGLYANPETAEQKDDWTSCLDANGNYLQPEHFNPIAYVGSQIVPKEGVQDAEAWPSGTTGAFVAGGFRMAFKVYYRNPRLSGANIHKDQEIFEKEVTIDINKKE